MSGPLEEGTSRKADKKGAVEYLNSKAQELSYALGGHWTAKQWALAANDAKRLAEVLAMLSEIDLNS